MGLNLRFIGISSSLTSEFEYFHSLHFFPDLANIPDTRRRLFRVLFGVAALAAIVAALRPISTQPFWGSHDKLMHGLVFFGLSALFVSARGEFGWRAAVLLAAGGLVVEVLQVLLPTRQFSLLDLAANLAGITVYWGIHRWRVASG